MTRVDFYLLESSKTGREQFACRLAEKAYKLGNRVYIHSRDPKQSNELDKLLWTFSQDSFVPHAIDTDCPDPNAAVLIGSTPELADSNHDQSRQVLINLAQDVPLFFSSFERVAEVVDQSQQNKDAGRDRYRFYRDRGYSLENHKIS
jgi:DNA polymerase-3 subunit chi